MIVRALIISESKVSIALLCQLCSTRYTAVRIRNYLNNLKSTDDFLVTQRKPSRATTLTLFTVSKDEWNTKEDVPEEFIARTAVCEKIPLGLKRRRTVKKSSP